MIEAAFHQDFYNIFWRLISASNLLDLLEMFDKIVDVPRNKLDS